MRWFQRLRRAAAWGLAAGAVGLAAVFSAGNLPLGALALGGGLLLQSPAAALHLLAGDAPALAARGPWKTALPAPTAAALPPTASPTPAAPPPSQTPAATAEPSAVPAPTATAAPAAGMGLIRAETFPQGWGDGYVTLAAGSIRNETANSDAELREAARGELPFAVALNSGDPQVLILHTHATESYQPWAPLCYDPGFSARTADRARNMCAVGEQMARILNDAGINTLHDNTLHDDPSYTESYARSAQTVRDYLVRYPSIKVVLDVHRDAIEQNGTRIKPLTSLDGQDAAQVMLICGCNNGDTVKLPGWRMNLRFAAAWETAMEMQYPGLTRPVLCGYRYYNQDLSTGSLLLEVGGHANTLDEALRGGAYAARALAVLFGAQPAG